MVDKKLLALFRQWYRKNNWKPFPFQEEFLHHYSQGKSGLLNAPTGSGKTYAAWIPIMMDYIYHHGKSEKPAYYALWITPVRSLVSDIRNALQYAVNTEELPWIIASRTGDTSASERKSLDRKPPQCLITTPESLHLMLSRKDSSNLLKNIKTIVVDEWHELLGTKRGVQVELALSRIRALNPDLITWGISATIGNLEEAMDVLNPGRENVIIRAEVNKKLEVNAILPDEIETFPWGGHLGIKLLDKVLAVIKENRTTLLFTNVRSQCEIWYMRLLEAAPDLAGILALHHGSLSAEIRIWVEDALHAGSLKAVVCTSSLDLGVDFRPVDTIIQIGSPKGIARFMQRAGRSGHAPGETSRIFFVPSHSLELIELAALKEALRTGFLESRNPVIRAFDVLAQYLLTLAAGDGFKPDMIYEEIIKTHCYRSVTKEEWRSILDFIITGGDALKSYPDYKKVEYKDGIISITEKRIAMRHRLSIGTIVSDASISIRYVTGGYIGSVEEQFITRMRPGDVFSFAGRVLELVRIKDMQAQVRNARASKTKIPQWLGGKLPLSSQLSQMIRKKVSEGASGKSDDPELKLLQPLFEKQRKYSIIPTDDQFLIECYKTKEGTHLFFFTFEGRYVNEGMAALIAYRISKTAPVTFSIAMTDYGFELLTDQDLDPEELFQENLFTADGLIEDLQGGLNATEMARRKFRNIAHIAGLIFTGYPGSQMKTRHIQASSGLFFDVFRDYEPNHLLLRQAYEEVLNDQLEETRLRRAIDRINHQEIMIMYPERPTPFCFPIMVERFREKLTTEKLEEKIRKMIAEIEKK